MSNGSEYKIGLTGSEPEKRRGTLNTASATRVDLLGYVLCKDMEALESRLHRKFMHNRQNGEWFDFNDGDLSKILTIFKKESINDEMSMFPNFKDDSTEKIDYVKMAQDKKRQDAKEKEERILSTTKRNVAKRLCELDMVRIQLLDEQPLYADVWEKYDLYNPDKYDYDSVIEHGISNTFDDISWGENTKEIQELLDKLSTAMEPERLKKEGFLKIAKVNLANKYLDKDIESVELNLNINYQHRYIGVIDESDERIKMIRRYKE